MRPLSLAALVLLAGCATMINGKYEDVPVDSYPSGAKIAVDCGGTPKDGGLTPARLHLERAAKECSITLTKDGYQPAQMIFARQESRATKANTIAAAPVAVIAAITGAILGSSIDAEIDGAAAGWDVGMQGGSAPGRQIDKRTGAAYKWVPGEVFLTLVRVEQMPLPSPAE